MQDIRMHSYVSMCHRLWGNRLFFPEHLKSLMAPKPIHTELMEVCKRLIGGGVCVGEWTCRLLQSVKAGFKGFLVSIYTKKTL